GKFVQSRYSTAVFGGDKTILQVFGNQRSRHLYTRQVRGGGATKTEFFIQDQLLNINGENRDHAILNLVGGTYRFHLNARCFTALDQALYQRAVDVTRKFGLFVVISGDVKAQILVQVNFGSR